MDSAKAMASSVPFYGPKHQGEILILWSPLALGLGMIGIVGMHLRAAMTSSPGEAALHMGTLVFGNITFHPQERVLRGVTGISSGGPALH